MMHGPSGVDEVPARLARVLATIRELEARYGRPPGSVGLVAVSKRQPAAAVRAAHAAGQRAFGENYAQEGTAKIAAVAERPIEWHFIGPLQGNKTAAVATAFDWVHTIDRERIARRLHEQRPAHLPPLNVCIQVNISGEASKSGIAPEALPGLVDAVHALPRLVLRGLMALPAPATTEAEQRRAFAQLARLAAACPGALDTLSMGTSDDFAAAIAEGATLVRLGTAVFGPRPGAA
jgi:pyridoxal phosphate enzyme (YggS family)